MGTRPIASGTGSFSVGCTAVRSENSGRSSGGSASRPLTCSTRTSEGCFSLRRAGRIRPETSSPPRSSQRRIWAADTYTSAAWSPPAAQEAAAVGQHVQDAADDLAVGVVAVVVIVVSESSPDSSPASAESLASLAPPPRERPPPPRGCAAGPGAWARRSLGVRARRPRRHRRRAGLGGLAALGADDGRHQIVTPQAAEALDSELGGDRVEIGQRALLEFALLQDCHLVRLLLGSKWDAGRLTVPAETPGAGSAGPVRAPRTG